MNIGNVKNNYDIIVMLLQKNYTINYTNISAYNNIT